MAIFRRAPEPVREPDPDPLEDVRSAANQLLRAREARDRAISMARFHPGVTQREIAEAADLSVARVKQISGPQFEGATHPGVTEVDLFRNDNDRVFSLEEVDPFLPRADTEQAFLAGVPERLRGNRYDLGNRLYDLDPTESWSAVWIESTKEIYAFKNKPRSQTFPIRAAAEPPEQPFDPTKGNSWGPCILLGHLPSWEVVDAGLALNLSNVSDRPGGLAWAYGRIRLINRLLASIPKSYGTFKTMKDIGEYLTSLPGSEQPGA